jgi:predicted RNase H-like HicB family nuclease
MNVGQFKKALRGLKDDTPIKIVTKGVRPYGYGGGELVDVEYASPCYNQEKPSEVWLDIYTNPPTKIIEENISNMTEKPREGWAKQFKKAEDMEDLEWQIDKVVSRLKTINPEREVDRQEIAQKVAEMKYKNGHVTYPMAGSNWNQLDFEKEREKKSKTFEYYMSLPYKMIIYPASEGGYVAEIPDLPGCLTQGDNWQDIFDMIQDAKAAWIDITMQEGRNIPVPNKS